MHNLIRSAYKIYKEHDLDAIIKLYDENKSLIYECINSLVYSPGDNVIYDEVDILYYNLSDEPLCQLSFLRAALVETMSHRGNASTRLSGEYEMNILSPKYYLASDVHYYIFLSSSPNLIKLYGIYILFFYLQTLYSTKEFICLDLEFTNKKNELIQQSFENHYDGKTFLWIVKPTELSPEIMDHFLNHILLNVKLTKILHGSDSLDIPFIYGELFKGDNEKIIQFTQKLIDTRFICEYHKIVMGEESNKCSIYDALLYFKVLSRAQYDRLLKIVDDMGPSQDVVWNLHKLSKAQILYALYDVLYLKQFYLHMLKASYDSSPEKHHRWQKDLYTGLLVEMIRFVYLERREASNIVVRCKTEIDPINNYMIRKNRSGHNITTTMISIYSDVIKGVVLPDPLIELEKIVSVNYFKGQLVIILKKIVYGILTQRYVIYRDKSNVYSEKLKNNFIHQYLDDMNFVHIKKFLRQFEILIEQKIDSYLDKY